MPIIADPSSGEGLIHRPNVEDSSEWSIIAGPFMERLLSKGGIGQLHQHVTIGSLPEDVLLNFFKYISDEMYYSYRSNEEWPMLVHVCQRWRNLAFRYPRHLNLELIYRPSERSVKVMLDIWPELPIYIWAFDFTMEETTDNVVAALRLNHRVSGIRFNQLTNSTWKTFAPLMEQPFPALTHFSLRPRPYFPKHVISRSFLGGSAPRLQDLDLDSLSFPALPNLLLAATHLVRLQYDDIPSSGYISPRAMVTGLSALTRLESLSLTFQSPGDLPDRTIRIPLPHTRILLPSLTYLRFQGAPEYMEDLVAQVDAPLLESIVIELFLQEVLKVSELAKFLRRADKLSLAHHARVIFKSVSICITLSSPKLLFRHIVPKTLMLDLTCDVSALRLSCLAQFCASSLPTLTPFESLYIDIPIYFASEDFIDNPDPQWLELLRIFTAVKHLHLSKTVARHVALALRGLLVGQVAEVLPALENVFIPGLEPSGRVLEAISDFTDARRHSGHPVSIRDWE